MTRKEKIEIMKQETKGRKITSEKPVKKSKPDHPDTETDKIREQLDACSEKSAELQDKYLRLSAEFDNYRKRTLREKGEMIKTASEDLLIKIIPFVDDIERGLMALNDAKDLNAIKEGMNLVYARFNDFLQAQGIREIEALNQDFNTDFHEAVTKIPVPDEAMRGKVVDVIAKGYLLHDKVIRYPKVVVGE